MLDEFIEGWCKKKLENYRNLPDEVKQDSNIEKQVLAGGYSYRQVLELVQNGADAVIEEAETLGSQVTARINVLFDGSQLYVANTGAPLSREGIKALLMSHSSPKRGNQIGRFGIGFKSLLRLGGTIDVLSSGAYLQFDPPRCQNAVREACQLPADAPAPSLRLAWARDREEAKRQDPQLSAFDWAKTVVRAEVKNPTMVDHLAGEIADFPSRFLLFIDTAVDLTLKAPDLPPLLIKRSHNGDVIILQDIKGESRWRLIEHMARIVEPLALEDAGDIHRRDEVPLTWAIPLDEKPKGGHFWAFFPTKTQTRIPGILNAPWKVGNDRQSLMDGEWNRALMREAAAMIAEALPTLADADDPARALDYLPRGLDTDDELAVELVERLWVHAGNVAIVPDATGTLRVGADLYRHPIDDKVLVERWCELATEERRASWVHPDCLKGNRSARLRGLADRLSKAPVPDKPGLGEATAADWFADIATAATEPAKSVIHLAADYANSLKPGDWNHVRWTLKIIPDRDGILRSPDHIWLARAEQTVPGRHFVSDALVSDPAIQQILRETLRIQSLLEDDWMPLLEEAIDNASGQERWWRQDGLSPPDWSRLWQILHSAKPEDQETFARKYRGQIRIRRNDGTWQYPYLVLLPGEIVPSTDPDPENHEVLVDLGFHRNDESLLQLLGAFDKPEGKQIVSPDVYEHPYHCPIDDGFPGWKTYASVAIRKRIREVQPGSRANPSPYFPNEISIPAGCPLLPVLKGTAITRLTSLLLSATTEEERVLKLRHGTLRTYPEVEVEHPLLWLLRIYGSTAIGNATIPLATIMSRCNEPALKGVDNLLPLLPTIQALAGSPRPEPTNVEALDTFWQALTNHLATRQAIADDSLTDLWRGAAADGWVPKQLPGPAGDIGLSEIYVTGSADMARRARTRDWTVIELDEETRTLWRQNGANDLDALFDRSWDEPVASFKTLKEVLPEIALVLSEEAKEQSYTQVVNGLYLCIREEREKIPCLHWEGVLYLDQAQLSALPARERLQLILEESAAAGWLVCAPLDALPRIINATLGDRRSEVSSGANLAERLLRAVASDVDTLRMALGEAACRALSAEVTGEQLAGLVLDLLGPAVLQDRNIKDAMQSADLQPPKYWGTDEARAFVVAIGFPEAFAQAQSRRLDAELLVAGPLPLPPLHSGYQVEVFNALKGLIEDGSGRRRAVVSLPTGGGKTRVVVQAAVELLLKPAGSRRTVLWIAQTEELCEQAVQSFPQVWQNLGAEGEALRVVRFWGGQVNPNAPADTEPTVVVASIQTLNSRFDNASLDWLATPGLVVVDECHHAITRSYTSLLRWLDAEAPRLGTPPKDEPPLLGLSATPFRTDDEESLRLAKRFDQQWYPSDQEGLYDRLLTGGFLARAEHRALETGTSVSPDLLDELDRLWDSGETTRLNALLERINQELASNDARNSRLIETLQASDARQILFFTNSVNHAEEMAARLCLIGIPAAPVSGETPATARRWFLDRFKSGDLRVLCNHSVLTTGFDAPRTDLVLIARQVKSPVSYMQMVGRGLRGPRNGGTETCTILTVLDNLGRFRERHPFHYCADLYKTH